MIKRLRVFFGIAVSLFFLFIVVRQMDFPNLISVLKQVNYIMLWPGFFVLMMFSFLYAVRWNIIFSGTKRQPGFKALGRCFAIGYMGNTLFPARFGEFLKIYVLKKREHVKISTSVATIIVEKMFDGLALMTILLGVILASDGLFVSHFVTGLNLQKFKPILFVLGALYFLILFGLILFRNQLKRIIKWKRLWLKPRFPKISQFIRKHIVSFAKGLSILKNFKECCLIYMCSLAIWVSLAFLVNICLNVCGIHLPLTASFLTMIFIVLGCFLPSSPGFLGSLQFFAILALSFYNVNKDVALGFSIVYHLMEYVPLTLAGLFFFVQGHFSVQELKEANQQKVFDGS